MDNCKKLAYIGGTGRSGSTLLDLLLGNHSLITSVGEVHRLNCYARENIEPCTCGLPVAECPYWRRIEGRMRGILGWTAERRPLLETEMMVRVDAISRTASWLQKAALVGAPPFLARKVSRAVASIHHEAMNISLQWYDAICAESGSEVLIDSTKDTRRMKLLFLTAPEKFRLIYLVRDGRAVTASEIRRNGVSMEQAASRWASRHQQNRFACSWIPSSSIFHVRYEELCSDTENILRKLAQFLGVPHEPAMLKLDKVASHNIGGNPMRFRKEEATIKLDEQWREQLTASELQVFQQIAGRQNKHFGYT